MASALQDGQHADDTELNTSGEMRALVRMFVVVLVIEILSLVGNYY